MGCSIYGIDSIMSSLGRRNESSREDYKLKLERKMCIAKESPDSCFDLSECGLKNVPSGIYSLCKVFRKEQLNLKQNFLHSLEDGGKISDLELIKILNLAQNKFSKISNEIGFLINLKELYLNDNKIKSLPDAIGKLVSLKILDVSQNQLSNLPITIGNLSNLKQLSVSGNKDLNILCKELCHAQKLKLVDLDGENFTFPPPEVATKSTTEIMKYLCEACNVEYIEPSDEEEVISNRSEPLMSPLENMSAARNALWEKEEEDLHQLESAMHKAAQEQKQKFLMEFSKEQMKIDSQLSKIQLQKDSERQNLIKQIRDEESSMETVVLQLLESNNKNPMQICQILNHEQKEHDRLLEMCRTNYTNMKTADTLRAMQSLLEEECQYEKSLKQYGCTQTEVQQSFLLTELLSNQQLQESLKTRDEMQSQLVERLLHDEVVQKAAVGALLEKCDSRSWGLVQEITLVENHLAKLSAIEIERKMLQFHDNLENLTEQRLKLSLVLVDLLEQQETRRSQLVDTLHAMELEKTTSPHFWLMRYQQLLDSVPEVVVSSQKKLDPLFANSLLQEGVIHCLPFLIRWLSSSHELATITDSLLLEQGVTLSSDRQSVLKAVRLYLEEMRAERLKMGNDGDRVSTVVPPAPTESDFSETSCSPTEDSSLMTDTKENSSECVVCMEVSCSIVFIPCGHLCCCVKCSDALELCPMCRSNIERKIRVVMP